MDCAVKILSAHCTRPGLNHAQPWRFLMRRPCWRSLAGSPRPPPVLSSPVPQPFPVLVQKMGVGEGKEGVPCAMMHAHVFWCRRWGRGSTLRGLPAWVVSVVRLALVGMHAVEEGGAPTGFLACTRLGIAASASRVGYGHKEVRDAGTLTPQMSPLFTVVHAVGYLRSRPAFIPHKHSLPVVCTPGNWPLALADWGREFSNGQACRGV